MLNLNCKILRLPIIFMLIFIFSEAPNSFGESNNAKNDIVVKDYTWRSHGPGRAAILQDITLKNLSLTDYKNIEVEIDFYSNSGTPRGSIRGTVKESLPAGSEVKYENIKFGIMNTTLEDSTAKVVGAAEEGVGPISYFGRSIIVKDVQFSESQYGTESFIETITLENKTNQNYKDVKIKISDLGVQGAKVGYEGYVNKIKVNKILPANSTVTLKNINIGFSHPDSKEKLVTVSEATPVSNKELKYLYGEQKDSIEINQGKQISEEEKRLSLVERYRQSLKEKNIKINEKGEKEEGDMSFSLTENVEKKEVVTKKKTVKPEPLPDTPNQDLIVEAKNKVPQNKLPEFEEDIEDSNEIVATEQPSESQQDIIVNATRDQNEVVKEFVEKKVDTVLEKTETTNEIVETDVIESRDTQVASVVDSNSDSGISSGGDLGVSSENTESGITFSDEQDFEETASIRQYDVAFEDEVPLPQHDLVVKKFSWGSGIPGTLGKLRRLILENISGIAYTDIDILVEYFSPNGIPLGSSQFKITEQVIEPNETKEFNNIDVGLVQLIPDESNIQISVRNAKDI